MKKHFWQDHKLATLLVTTYLVIYTLLHQAGASLQVLGAMFLLSPFLVAWMAYTILKHAQYHGRELQDHEEWGYGDKRKDELGNF
jgi:hypothetical protein